MNLTTQSLNRESPGTVLLTGATGIIGRQAIAELVRRGFEVHCAARRQLDDTDGRVTWHCVDLLAEGAAAGLVEKIKPSHLMHFAWNATPGQYWSAVDNLDWVAASLRLYRAFGLNGGRRAVFAGSCAEYDWQFSEFDEASSALAPHSLYGEAKRSLGAMIGASSKTTGVSTAWGRIFFVYGPHEHTARFIPEVILSLLEGRPAICSEGLQERDFMHTEDIARAFVTLLESDHEGPVNIASGECVPIRKVVLRLGELTGRGELIQLGVRPTAAGDPARLAAKTEVLRHTLSFKPRYSLDSGLASVLDWWREQVRRRGRS